MTDHELPHAIEPEEHVNTKAKRIFTGPLYPEGTPVIEVWNEGHRLCCKEFGEISGWHATQQDSHPVADSRHCLHRLDPMPKTQLFGANWLRELHWQTVPVTFAPALAAREDGVVMIAYDVVGPVEGCTNNPSKDTRRIPDENRWYYQLYPICWRDQPNIPEDHVLLGVLTQE